MASSSVNRRPNGKWRARYRDALGKEHARHFDRKTDAQAWLDSVTVAVGTGTYVSPRDGKVTVAAVAEAWVASMTSWTPSTRARNESILTRHVLPRWGRTGIASVTFEGAQVWVAELTGSGLAGGSVRKIAGVLASVLDFAVKSRRIPSNPVRGVDLPKQALARRRYLSGMQVETLAEAAREHRDVVLTLAYCGLRFGELAGLRARHVDMLRRRFLIEESVTDVNGVMVWTSPKDHQRRSVPFPAFLVEPLSLRVGSDPEAFVFPAARGGVLRIRNARRSWFDEAAVEAGMPGLTPHELRHTAASMAVSAGASVLALQRMLGHDKPSTTLDVYSDLFDEDLDAVAERLGDARGRVLADRLRTDVPADQQVVVSISR